MDGKTIAKKMQVISNGINGALNNPKIMEALAPFSYTREKILQGRTLWNKANILVVVQVKEYGDQYAATQSGKTQWSESYANYMIVLKVARVAFKGDVGALATILATGSRSKSLSGWLRESRVFYTNLLNNPDYVSRMEEFGFTSEKLINDLHLVEEVEKLHQQQLKEIGEAQQATINRDKALDELYEWYSDFRAIARIALYETPQLLEGLGISVKS